MSRTKETFVELKNTTTIYQYLYMNANHRIQFKNVINTPIEIRMTDDCKILAKNLNFPNVEETLYKRTDIPNMLALIKYLKKIPAEHPNDFDSRWDEIKTIVNSGTVDV